MIGESNRERLSLECLFSLENRGKIVTAFCTTVPRTLSSHRRVSSESE